MVGGVTALCGPVSGAIITGIGSGLMEVAEGETNPEKIVVSMAVGAGSSLLGSAAGKLTQKIG